MGKLDQIFKNKGNVNSNKRKDKITGFNKSFKLDGYSTEDLQMFVKEVGLDDDSGTETELYNHLGVAALTVVMLVQLRYSCLEAPQYFDGLPSTKYFKKKVLCTTPGVTWCTMIPAYETFDFLNLSLMEIFEVFIGEPIIPSKKIQGKITKENSTEYFKSRRSSLLGKLQSCPATQAAHFGLDRNCVNWDIDDAIKFIFPNGLPHGLTKEDLVKSLNKFILTGSNDTKLEKVVFDEPNNLTSKIETEALEGKVLRNGKVDTTIKSSGTLPNNRPTENMLLETLDSSEFRRYKVALRFGDNKTLRELNNLVNQRLQKLGEGSEVAPDEIVTKSDGVAEVALSAETEEVTAPTDDAPTPRASRKSRAKK